MSESSTPKFAPWVFGIVAGVLVIGIGAGTTILFKLNASVEVLTARVSDLTHTIDGNVSSTDIRLRKLEDDVDKLKNEAAERRGRSQTIHGE